MSVSEVAVEHRVTAAATPVPRSKGGGTVKGVENRIL